MKSQSKNPRAVKRCLILSDGPVPTPEHSKVEGGGLRCWGLAKGIKQNEPAFEVTIAYSEEHRIEGKFTDIYEDILIRTWALNNISEMISEYDTVIVSYCMGDLSVMVAGTIGADQQLILDCYVPIYIEVSARNSKQVEEEYKAFEHDVVRWDTVLKRGDLFLCANEPQKNFYKGVLAAVGRVNPVTYSDDLILIAPYGIYRTEPEVTGKPVTNLIGNDVNYMRVLWFGGIYPWFDIRVLADAVLEVNKATPAKLIVVGAKNPFNRHPDFINRYEEFIQHVSKKELKDNVIVQDWINFNDRANWYFDSDVVIVCNKEGEENKLAWRTRLVDFMWADLPVLTNGGDPLSELMINNGAAVRMDVSSSKKIADALINLSKGNDRLNSTSLKNNMRKLKTQFYWDVVTKQLAAAIAQNRRAQDLQRMGVFSVTPASAGEVRSSAGRIISKAKKIPAYAKKYGYRATVMVMTEMMRRKLQSKNVIQGRKTSAYVFVSHQLDMSGAPFIAMDMAMEFKAAGKKVEFYTYLPTHKDNLLKLNKAGIKPHVLMNKDMVPSFISGDTVVLNTVAHSEVVKEAVFRHAETNQLNVIWYLHEDDPELLFRGDEKARIKHMLEAGQMKLLIAAHKMRSNYIHYFGTNKNILLQPYKHVVPRKYHRTLNGKVFTDKLSFVLPGTISDGRKGQLPIFYAFLQFYEAHFRLHKELYRDFELVLVGTSDDFLSRQILAHAPALEGHFKHYGRVTWSKCLDIIAECNVTICYSIRECLPLFVFEGMISGHPILRNDSSGMEEQLIVGKNGLYLESRDFNQVVKTIETMLNKQKTPDSLLAKMSKKSYEIAKVQETHSYLTSIEE